MNRLERSLPSELPGQVDLGHQEVGAFLFEAAEATDETKTIAAPTWNKLKDVGLLVAPFPTEFGGVDLIGPSQHQLLCSVLRSIGSGDLSVARLYEGHVNAIALVCRFGQTHQVSALAEDTRNGLFSGVWQLKVLPRCTENL